MRDGAWRRHGAKGVTVVVIIAAVAGAIVLGRALTVWIPVGLAIFTVVATWRVVGKHVLEAVCAAVIALLALLSLAVAIRFALGLFTDRRLPIPAGLALALVVFFGVAVWYLGGNWFGGRDQDPGPVGVEEQAGAGKATTGWLALEIPSPQWRWTPSVIGAATLAIGVVLGLPVLVGVLQRSSERRVVQLQGVVSKIDAFIVADPLRAGKPDAGAAPDRVGARLGPYAHADAFAVRWSVGFATGDGVRWTLAGSDDEQAAFAALADPDAPTVPRPGVLNDADRVLLLLVDGTPPVVAGDPAERPDIAFGRPGEVERWRRVAAAAAPAGTPSYPLLETTVQDRIDEWRNFVQRGTAVRRGGPISFQRLGSRTVTDAAVRLAVGAPTAQEDYSLALRHRPILRFDEGEQAPRPLSVEDLFATKRVKLCFTKLRPGDLVEGRLNKDCETVPSAAKLVNGDSHLELPLPPAGELRRQAREEREQLARELARSRSQPADAPRTEQPRQTPPAPSASRLGEGSAIYVHPVPSDSEDVSYLYLDYWWYLPYNPAESGSGAFCGPGFVIPGISCFDHVSDWEGVTVVLDRTTPGRKPTPIAVHYAQHSGVARYRWEDLRAAWEDDPDARRIRGEIPDAAERPVVFVARGTHASYPLPCRRESQCRQVLEDAEEKRHDGRMPWAGNVVPTCGDEDCLKLLPTARGGRDPALWNSFDGPWGARHCWLTYYCDSGSPPEAPGQQERYQAPWENDGTHAPADGRRRVIAERRPAAGPRAASVMRGGWMPGRR